MKSSHLSMTGKTFLLKLALIIVTIIVTNYLYATCPDIFSWLSSNYVVIFIVWVFALVGIFALWDTDWHKLWMIAALSLILCSACLIKLYNF